MSSIYQDQADEETKKEIEYLEEKKAIYGWTDVDAGRYNYLKSTLNTTP